MFWRLQENVINETDIKILIDFIQHTKRFTQFEKVREFEKEFSRWLGTEYCVYVNSGSSANLLLIAALKELHQWKLNDEIIVPAVTWVTNVSPVMQCGLNPVFVDINLEDLSFDYTKLEAAITPKTKAIFVTHLIGLPADINRIKDIIGNRDILILEDCCESHGAMVGNIKIGNFGIGSTFSFYWGHHITTVEGGAVCTNDEDLYKLLVLKRSHGLARELPVCYHKEIRATHPDINFDFLFLTDGYNVRNTEFNAVLGLNQLKKIDKFIQIRNDNNKRFLEICEPYEEDLILFRNQGISSFVLPFLFRHEDRMEDFLNIFAVNGIESRPIVSGNLLRQPFLKQYYNSIDFPNADLLHSNGCYIGNNQFVDNMRLNQLEQIMEEYF